MNPGHLLASRFEIEARAGEGAMGSVFRARDRHSGSLVALKVIRSTATDAVERFVREAAVLSTIRHPAIVRYVDHGVGADSESYLAMEWLEGETLTDRLARGTLSVSEALELAERVSGALAVAHAHGIVHRDIKPSNLFLVDGRPERVKILDFGIAHLGTLQPSTTRTGTVLGTPGYMAPEQARGTRDIDARADVFSLGSVLYECLAGETAFGGEHVMAVLAKILFAQVPLVSALRPDVPPGLDDLLARMLAKSPDDRPKNGAAVAAAIDSLRRGEIAARQPDAVAAITRGERRVFSVVLAASASRGPRRDPHETNRLANAPPPIDQLRIALAPTGAKLEPLADGGVVATLAGDGSATDRTAAAARCALAMRERLTGIPMALTTARAVLEGNAPPGDVIDRAARLLASSRATDPNAVILDEVTAGLLDARFDVRGGAGALELHGEHAARDVTRRLLGRPTTTVGRDRELRSLEAIFDECVGESVARAVLITASTGAGKSRLRWELARRLERRERPPEMWIGRGDPLHAGAPFGLLSPALRRAIGLGDGEPGASQQSKLRARVGRHFSGPDLRRVSEFLGELLGVPFSDVDSVPLRAARRDAVLMGDRMRQAWEDWLDAECRERPIVLVLEDLQWGDSPTVAFVDAALRALRDRPLLVLALARPEVRQLFPQLWHEHPFTEIRLGELSRKACEKLVFEALGERIDPSIAQRIVERAGGNAFYLEELIRAVSEGASELPETVLAMVQARLESLPAEQRRVLRAASVFGQTFWKRGVCALLGADARDDASDWLSNLGERELISRRGLGRFPGEEEYVFRHSTVREAAYASLTDDDRALGHRLAAEWLVGRETDAIALAEHFDRGGVPERAGAHYLGAAEQALAASDFGAVLSRAERAIACGVAGESLGNARLLQAEAHRWRGEHVDAATRSAEAAERLPAGSPLWFRAVEEALSACGRQGNYGPAVAWSETALSTVPTGDDRDAQIVCLCAAGRQLFHAGRYDLAERVIARVHELAAGDLDAALAAHVHGLDAARARHVGDLLGDLRGYERVLHAFEAAGDARSACNTRVSLGFAHVELGDFARAEVELRAALDAAEKMGLATIATRARQNLGLVLAWRGAFAEAAELEERTIAESVAQGNKRFEGWTRIYLSSIALAAGELDRAEREARIAAERLAVTPPARAGALAALARALVAQGRAIEALSHAREGALVLESLGGIEEFESLVRLALAEAHRAAGDEGGARSAIARAADRIHERAARIEDPEWRASFLERVPENAHILSLAHDWHKETHGMDRLRAPFDVDTFRTDGHRLVDQLADYLGAALRGEGPVAPAFAPAEMSARWPARFPEEPALAELGPIIARAIMDSNHQHHPRYVGHQVTPPLPHAALVSFAASLINNGMASYEAGPAATAMERTSIGWLAERVGFPPGADGVLTSGGSLGNLTALLAARQAKAGFDAWGEGSSGGPPLAILAPGETHYSVARAAQILGLGHKGVIPVAVDERYRLRPDALAEAMDTAERTGRRVFAVVANAGSTSTGAIDPLDAVADFCAARSLWFHVDGAHGASLALSSRHRARLAGIERADSIVWDAHKLMLLPALTTAVLFRDGAAGAAAFSQRAHYLFARAEERPYDLGLRTMECTKRMMSLQLYATLSLVGTRFFDDYVSRQIALARSFAAMIASSPDFELAIEPEINIVCFRWAAGSDELQDRLRRRVHASGGFFLTRTQLGERVHLRVTLMNPFTTDADLAALLDAIRAAAAESRDAASVTTTR